MVSWGYLSMRNLYIKKILGMRRSSPNFSH